VRSSDILARIGGEEFAALLPDTDAQGAVEVAERIRAAVAALEIEADAQTPVRPTVSLGVAERVPGDDVAALLSRADDALYRAKATGRNRVAGHR
jgi:diguanylate cyclase (GGDEF)-like protein